MGLSAATIATSIAALSISGVTVKDLTAIPQQVLNRDCPILYPDPDEFMTGLEVQIDSMGIDSLSKKTGFYTLHYQLCYAEIGAGRGLFDYYQGLVQTACAVLDAIIAHSDLTGAIDTQPEDVVKFGLVTDIAGNQFHGARFAIRVKEFIG